MSLLGGFGRSARTRGWAVLDGLRSKELIDSVKDWSVYASNRLISHDHVVDDRFVCTGKFILSYL